MKFSLLKQMGIDRDGSVAFYNLVNFSDEEHEVLGYYFSEEVLDFIDSYSKFYLMKENFYEPIGGNFCCTGIRRGKMTIGYLYDDDPYIVEMSKKQYGDMLRVWDELIHKKVKNILITIGEDEAVTLKAISDDEAKKYEKKP